MTSNFGKSNITIPKERATEEEGAATADSTLDALGGTAKANDWRVADLTRAEIGGAEQRPSELRYLTRDVPKKERVEVTFGAAAARVLCALAPAPELAVAALDWQGGGKSVNTEAAARAVAAGALRLDTGALSRLGLARALLAEAPAEQPTKASVSPRHTFIPSCTRTPYSSVSVASVASASGVSSSHESWTQRDFSLTAHGSSATGRFSTR